MTLAEAKKFVTAWQGSNSLVEVTEKTGMAREAVISASRALRKKGVALKMYGKSTTPFTQLEIEELKGLANLKVIVAQVENRPRSREPYWGFFRAWLFLWG